MKNKFILHFTILLLISVISFSCSSAIYDIAYPTLNDGKYDTEFPYRNCSQQLEEINKSVKLINCIAFYQSYIFDINSNIKLKDLNENVMFNRSASRTFFESTESGTATVIYSGRGYTALLTCSHIIDFPDTVISYFTTDMGNTTDIVQSISIKTKQKNYLPEAPTVGEFEIILNDKQLDAAIIGLKSNSEEAKLLPVLRYPLGAARELEWGSFVYIFGYPLNYKMVSKAIVSNPKRDRKSSFLLDAVFNRGFSGGIVLAVRDGVPNFEVVGMVRSVPAEFQSSLVPEKLKDNLNYNPRIPYTGQLFVERRMSINYGITTVVSIEAILEFIEANEDLLEDRKIFIKEELGSGITQKSEIKKTE